MKTIKQLKDEIKYRTTMRLEVSEVTGSLLVRIGDKIVACLDVSGDLTIHKPSQEFQDWKDNEYLSNPIRVVWRGCKYGVAVGSFFEITQNFNDINEIFDFTTGFRKIAEGHTNVKQIIED